VLIGRLEHGWSWRIPLPGPRLAAATAARRRVSAVARDANYQLISARGAGAGVVKVASP